MCDRRLIIAGFSACMQRSLAHAARIRRRPAHNHIWVHAWPCALSLRAREQLTYSMNAFGRSLGSCATDQLSMWYGSGHAVGDASMAVVAVFSW
jgi:hypothetical protein